MGDVEDRQDREPGDRFTSVLALGGFVVVVVGFRNLLEAVAEDVNAVLPGTDLAALRLPRPVTGNGGRVRTLARIKRTLFKL